MTRAKALMIIIGNPDIICTNKYWKSLWEYCTEQGSCIPFTWHPPNPSVKKLTNNDSINSDNLNASNAKTLSVTVLGKKKKNEDVETRILDNVLVRTMKNVSLSKDNI